MKRHVFHPLWVTIGLVGLIFVARLFLVPSDFGVHGDSFTYNYYRQGNVQEWMEFPVKYQGKDSCAECHKDKVKANRRGPHKRVECENCHGPGAGHPEEVELLPLNRDRAMCLRCHADLDYPASAARSEMPAINDQRHRRNRECAGCHDPHDPREDAE